jgi:hypothetical protein
MRTLIILSLLLLGAWCLRLPAVAAQNTGTVTAEVTWSDDAVYESGWRVYRAEGPNPKDADFILVGVLPAGTRLFTDTGLRPNTWYSYRVGAFNTLNEVVSDPARKKTPNR